jgi:hypothetical protein
MQDQPKSTEPEAGRRHDVQAARRNEDAFKGGAAIHPPRKLTSPWKLGINRLFQGRPPLPEGE